MNPYQDLQELHSKDDILALELQYKENEQYILCYSNYNDKYKYKNFIFDKTKNKVVAVSHKRVDINNFEKVKLWIQDENISLYTHESYEGTNVLMFFSNNEWHFSTTKYIDASTCNWKSEQNVLELFQDVVTDDNDENNTWQSFLDNHNKMHIYNYSILHHENIHLIDYSLKFGSNYKKLFLHSIRDQDTFFMIPFDEYISFLNIHNNILKPEFIDQNSIMITLSHINQDQYYIDYCKNIQTQGLIVVNTVTEEMVNLQSEVYNTYFICNQQNKYPCSFSHYLNLYKKNFLDIYLEKFTQEKHFNNLSIKQLIHNTLIEISKDILILFKTLYHEDNYEPVKEYENLYKELPYIYKNIFYQLKGYYRLKISCVPLTVNKVYKLVKKLPVHKIMTLIKERRNIKGNISGLSMYKNSKISSYIENIHSMQLMNNDFLKIT